MYSQKEQVGILIGLGAPKTLPKDPSAKLNIVAGGVADLTPPPPERTHTGTTKGGASTSGSAGDQIPDPDVAPEIPSPQTLVPTMAPGGGGGDRSASTAAAPPQAFEAQVTQDSPRGQGWSAGPMTGPGEPKSGWGDSALPTPSAGLLEESEGREVRDKTRTPAPRLARDVKPHHFAPFSFRARTPW